MDSFWHKISDQQLHEDPAIQVYQTNFLAARLKALEHSYPISFEVFGVSIFQAIAKHYVQAIPSVNDSLNAYGEYFPDFISEIIPHNPKLAHFRFLPEIAQIDWLLIQAYFAPDNDVSACISENDINNTSYLSLNASLGVCAITQPVLLSSKTFHQLYERKELCSEDFSAGLLNELSSYKDSTTLNQQKSVTKNSVFLAIIRQDLSIKIYLLTEFEFNVLSLIRERTPIFKLDELVDSTLSLDAITKFKQWGFISGLMNKVHDSL